MLKDAALLREEAVAFVGLLLIILDIVNNCVFRSRILASEDAIREQRYLLSPDHQQLRLLMRRCLGFISPTKRYNISCIFILAPLLLINAIFFILHFIEAIVILFMTLGAVK